jgi:allene oxide cyclase-like protein
MGLGKRTRRRLLIAGVAISGAAVGVIPASAATGKAATDHHCVHLTLIEPTIRIYLNAPVDPTVGVVVGTQVAYFDPLLDTSGHQIGQSVGMVDILYRASNGHLIQDIDENLQLPGGTLLTTGTYDRVQGLSGAWETAPLTGLSGAYAGMSGTWTWRVTSHVAPFPVQEELSLCTDHDRG